MVASARSRPLTAAAVGDVRFQGFLVLANGLLRLPGHALRLMTLRRLCRVPVGERTAIERGRSHHGSWVSVAGRGCNINEGSFWTGEGS